MSQKLKFGKNYSLLLAGQITSLFGSAILRFSLPLSLLRITASSSLFGLVVAFSFVPMVVMSVLGGVWADRVNKRTILVFFDLLSASVIVFFLLLQENAPTIPLYTITLMLLYGVSGADQPSVQASIPALVPKEKILPATAIVNQIGFLTSFIAPVAGGVLYGTFGIEPILKISVVCFVLSAFVELFIVMPFTKKAKQGSMIFTVKSDLQESWLFLKREKPVFVQICFIIAGLNLFLSSMLMIGIPVIIVDVLALPDRLLGFAQGLFAIGGVLGGLLSVIFEKHLRPQKAFVLLFLCSAFALLMGLGMMWAESTFFKYCVLAILGALVTTSSTMFSIQMLAIVQAETPPSLVGKVLGFIMTFIMCAQPLGQVLYGFLFDKLSQNIAIIFVFSASISFVISLCSIKILAKIERKNGNA